jgi:tetraacyldisaccharide 4'-kinase
VLLHPYPDHHVFDGSEVNFDEPWPVVCTEKDAVKLRMLEGLPSDCWSLEVELSLDDDTVQRLDQVLRKHGIAAP